MKKQDNKGKFIFILLSVFIFLFLISFTSAAQLNQPYNVTISCAGFTCSNVNITIYNSVSGVVVNNQPMASHSYYTSYQFTPSLTGNYTFYYSDGANSSSGSFIVTPTGNENTTTFLFVFLSIITLTFILGVSLKNNWIMFFAFLEILFFGFWIIAYGIDIIKNTTTTWALGLILWGISILGMYKSVQGMIEEGGNILP